MIIDSLNNLNMYITVHKRFKKAFDFLKNDKLANLIEGKYTIDGDEIFAIIDKTKGRNQEDAFIEAHKKYIDIQFLINGCEKIGYKPVMDCKSIKTMYEFDKDLMFFNDDYTTQLELIPNTFAIFFPCDGHAPLIGNSNIHKAIIKIKVD